MSTKTEAELGEIAVDADERVSGFDATEVSDHEGASAGAVGASDLDSAAQTFGGLKKRFTEVGVGTSLGRYLIEEELGEGGMATVYRATDSELRRQVAIKVMFPHVAKKVESARRFKREARAAASLEHPHVLRVLDVGGGDEEAEAVVPPYIVLELVEGESLAEVLEGGEALEGEVVAALGVLLCDALAAAHQIGIVHRDIKPANVLTTVGGRVLLADFGVARVDSDESLVTKTGAVLGTPAYMAPEQASGEKVDARTDLYSLGATLYHLATGQRPYGGSPVQIIAAISSGKLVSPERRNPGMGRDLSRIIETLMATEPDERYDTALAVKEALERILSEADLEAAALVERYLGDPEGERPKIRAQVARATLVRARKLGAEGKSLKALALAERVCVLDPGNQQAEAILRTHGEQKSQRLWIAIAGPFIVTLAVGAFFWLTQKGPATLVDNDALQGGTDAAAAGSWDVGEEGALQDPSEPLPVAGSAGAAEVETRVREAKGTRIPFEMPSTADVPRGSKVKSGSTRTVETIAASEVDTAEGPVTPEEVETASVPNATLVVDIRPWCDVVINGESKRRASPSHRYELAPGSYEVRCEQGATGLAWQGRVVLAPGEERKVEGTVLPPVRVRSGLGEGVEVELGGQRWSGTMESRLTAGRYRAVLYRAGRRVGSKYLSLRGDCQLVDKPSLGCRSE